ncbi:MAG: hypothetical protein H7Y36_03760 [Armatimonadetes bacterium]|nr:hypothetical protein [Akkermansiaceae bacterium]
MKITKMVSGHSTIFAFSLLLICIFVGYFCMRFAFCDIEVSLPNPPTIYSKGGRGVTFEVNVRNLGPDRLPSNSYNLSLLVDGTLVTLDSRGNEAVLGARHLVVHGKQKEHFEFSPSSSGIVSYSIIVKPKWNCRDINMKNNRFSGQFHVTDAVGRPGQ